MWQIEHCIQTPKAEIEDYYVVFDGRNFFNQPFNNVVFDGRNHLNQSFNNYKGTYVNILNITNDQGDDYTTGCHLDYPYFKEHYKMKTIGLSKQPALDAHHVLILYLSCVWQLNAASILQKLCKALFWCKTLRKGIK